MQIAKRVAVVSGDASGWVPPMPNCPTYGTTLIDGSMHNGPHSTLISRERV